MRRLLAPLAALVAYSAWLVRVEVVGGQAALRPYVADVGDEVLLYAVNTTVSAASLLAAGVLWLTCQNLPERRPARFGLLQGGLLIALAADDRFALHERVGTRLGIDDALLLGAVGVAQVVLLAVHRDLAVRDRAATMALLAAGAAAALMLGIDLLGAEQARLRLAAEEVTKTWGGAALLLWSWLGVRTLSRARA